MRVLRAHLRPAAVHAPTHPPHTRPRHVPHVAGATLADSHCACQRVPTRSSAQAALPGTVAGPLLHGLLEVACLAMRQTAGCGEPRATLAGGGTGAGHLVAGGGHIKGAHSALRPFTILPADRQPPPHHLLACPAAGALRSAMVSLLSRQLGRRRAGDRHAMPAPVLLTGD